MRSEWLRRMWGVGAVGGVLTEPNFRRFYTGYVTSLLGSSMSTVAIAFAVLDSRVSATGLGLVFTANVVIVALAGPSVVVAVDAFTYLVSVLALSLLRLPPGAREPGAREPGAREPGAREPGAREPGARGAGEPGGAGRPARRVLFADIAEGWAEFRSRTWLWAGTVQFAFFNLITWAPWMLLGPVMGRAYLGGAAV